MVWQMRKSIYPEGGRTNGLYGCYFDIAVDNYYEAQKNMEIIRENKYAYDCLAQRMKLENYLLVSVVFSAMAIESFINDYAAACMGDEEFYNNFDRLSPLSKVQLIAKFIFCKDLDKSKECYSCLKFLFKKRDGYVHNKSHSCKLMGYSKEEIREIEDARKAGLIEEISEPYPMNKAEIESTFREGTLAIKAVRELARFFDEHETSVYATNRLIGKNRNGMEAWRKWIDEL